MSSLSRTLVRRTLSSVNFTARRAQFSTAKLLAEQVRAPQPTQQEAKEEPLTHFGFTNVPESEKETLVGQVFANVASKYDIMNDAMSGGVHRLWKDHFIRKMDPAPGTKLLDVAGGTGDIAMRFLNYCKEVHGDKTASVTMMDINPNMLKVGEERFQQTPYHGSGQISFKVGNAEKLTEVPDSSVDVYTIAFGIRNCTHVDKVLEEAHRVLKPGGRFMCLEFSRVDTPIISSIYDLYSFHVIPAVGEIVANDRNSYQYLVESIRKFPDQKTFAQMIRNAGFTTVGDGYENLTFGVAAIHSGIKL
ncbi:ubiquinone/menaquinone [Basidiobolus meristosporus CBS 931.73]|uniref:2-methoxy-6-polyprenyl-1,4-benzoquinol methylase, mitochondrial n=1 Tax=Basidiobolus meristosporus CBS 931.73 TaxID=1314790 RepID=A0A1Y1Z5P9_9FUNG|nr:ubiquinone/menaquinone [Basidiobolus meristosporus CBS 931.73]|eukprot:ORY05444.1 ubiquinone/menaquinone [Basidiobolus meristosporus CBS 931.73]